MARKPLVADLEADGLLPTATTIWQISVYDPNKDRMESYNDASAQADGKIKDGIKRVLNAHKVVWHNGLGYDLLLIAKLYPKLVTREHGLDNVIDTLVLSRLGNPERLGGHSLRRWGGRVGMAKPDDPDFTCWSPKMEHRCHQDVRITAKVWERLKPMTVKMPEACRIEHDVAWVIAWMTWDGFRLDVEKAEKLMSDLMDEQEQLEAELKEIFGPVLVPVKPSQPEKVLKVVNKRHPMHGLLAPGSAYCPLKVEEFNPGSRPQIAKRLKKQYNWKPTKFTDAGSPKVDENTLAELEFPEAPKLLRYLELTKMIGQIGGEKNRQGKGGGWLKWVEEDGRVRCSINPCATVTHRSSCNSPNLQQADSDHDMRDCWIARDGYKLVGSDAASLQFRLLGHYLGRYDGGAFSDIVINGTKEDKTTFHYQVMNVAGTHVYKKTKNLGYGWLFGAGDGKIGLIMQQDAYEAGKEIDWKHLGISATKSRVKIGKAVRKRIEQGFEGLEKLVNTLKEKGRRGYIRGLDGRKIRVRALYAILNTLLMSAESVVVKKAISLMFRDYLRTGKFAWGSDLFVVMWAHDEIQMETKPEIAEGAGEAFAKCVTKAGKELNVRCPLDGDSAVGNSWADTH